MMSRVEIKAWAWQAVKQNYWPTIGVYLVLQLIMTGISMIPGANYLLIALVGNVVTVGSMGFFLYRFRGWDAQLGMIFWPFSRYGRVVGGMLWKTLWIILWSLLFIIPGIVKSYSYFCMEYILADSPKVEAFRALELSKRLMDGNKAKVFIMHLSFLGWALLGVAILFAIMIPTMVTQVSHVDMEDMLLGPLGIFSLGGVFILGPLVFYAYMCLFLGPYMAATSAGFYEEIKRDAIFRGVAAAEEFDLSEQELAYWQNPQYWQQQQAYGGQQYGQQYGEQPYSQQAYGQPSGDQPYGQPSGDQPYAQPQPGQAPYVLPPYGQAGGQQPGTGQPSGQSPYDQPPYAQPPSGEQPSVQDVPSSEQPGDQSLYGQQAHDGQPSGQSPYDQPPYASSYDSQPDYEQPALPEQADELQAPELPPSPDPAEE